MITNPATNVQLQALRAADLRRDADSRRTARQARAAVRAARTTRYVGRRPVPAHALRDRLGWSLVQLGLRLVDRPSRHPLVAS